MEGTSRGKKIKCKGGKRGMGASLGSRREGGGSKSLGKDLVLQR